MNYQSLWLLIHILSIQNHNWLSLLVRSGSWPSGRSATVWLGASLVGSRSIQTGSSSWSLSPRQLYNNIKHKIWLNERNIYGLCQGLMSSKKDRVKVNNLHVTIWHICLHWNPYGGFQICLIKIGLTKSNELDAQFSPYLVGCTHSTFISCRQ